MSDEFRNEVGPGKGSHAASSGVAPAVPASHAASGSPSSTSEFRAELLKAFRAGFDLSCEGFNGEYVRKALREPGELDKRIKAGFDHWRQHGKAS